MKQIEIKTRSIFHTTISSERTKEREREREREREKERGGREDINGEMIIENNGTKDHPNFYILFYFEEAFQTHWLN